jgi:hypothetical protein
MDHADIFSTSAVAFGLVTLCKNTRFRAGASAAFPSGEARIMIHRADVSGSIVLQPMLVLTDPSRAAASFPAIAGARLATGFPITILADAPGERPGGGIEIQWHDFGAEHRDALFELVIEPPDIVLRLNNEHGAFKTIVTDQSKTGNRARMRNAMFALIACDVWLQLAEFAAREAVLEEEPEGATAGLAHSILKSLSKLIRIAPQEIVQSFDDAAGRAMLSVRIQHALKTGAHQTALLTASFNDEEGA